MSLGHLSLLGFATISNIFMSYWVLFDFVSRREFSALLGDPFSKILGFWLCQIHLATQQPWLSESHKSLPHAMWRASSRVSLSFALASWHHSRAHSGGKSKSTNDTAWPNKDHYNIKSNRVCFRVQVKYNFALAQRCHHGMCHRQVRATDLHASTSID